MEKVKFDLITQKKLKKMNTEEKIDFLLEEVKKDKILILERGLNPIEETKLIETTMSRIDQETFVGIELESYEAEPDADEKIWHKLLKRDTIKPRITVIGPAEMMKTIYKDGDMLQAIVYKQGKPEQFLQQEAQVFTMNEIMDESKEIPIMNDMKSFETENEIPNAEIIEEKITESESPIIDGMMEEEKVLPIMEIIKDEMNLSESSTMEGEKEEKMKIPLIVNVEGIEEQMDLPLMEIIKEEKIVSENIIMADMIYEKNESPQFEVMNEKNLVAPIIGVDSDHQIEIQSQETSTMEIINKEYIERETPKAEVVKDEKTVIPLNQHSGGFEDQKDLPVMEIIKGEKIDSETPIPEEIKEDIIEIPEMKNVNEEKIIPPIPVENTNQQTENPQHKTRSSKKEKKLRIWNRKKK